MENDAEVVFVNNLEMSGCVNGVINMSLSTNQFVPVLSPHVPGEEPKLVASLAPKITANLRFDLYLAQQIRDRLDMIIDEHTKPKVSN